MKYISTKLISKAKLGSKFYSNNSEAKKRKRSTLDDCGGSLEDHHLRKKFASMKVSDNKEKISGFTSGESSEGTSDFEETDLSMNREKFMIVKQCSKEDDLMINMSSMQIY
jgi:hypothetical protein